MQIFKYKEDRLPVMLFVTYFMLDLLVFFLVENPWWLFAWLLIGIFPKTCICAWNHHHQHVPHFKHTFLNRVMDIIYGFQTGLCGHAWVLHHVIGHHVNYLNQAVDESRWKNKDGTLMNEEDYALDVTLTSYWRAYKAGKKYPRLQKIFVVMVGIQLSLLAFFLYYNWVNALLVFVLPMLISLYMTARATYEHHAGLDTDDHLEASYNVMHKWYNIFTGNLGYHTAHHMKQGLHWSKLPEFHKEIEAKIAPHLYKEPGFPFNWMPER
jgi:hypothetical protein